MPNGRGSQAWRKLRAEILTGDPTCAMCGRARATTVDHIIPLAYGGALLDRTNLRPACARCNYRAGQKITAQILRTRSAIRKARRPQPPPTTRIVW
jgi:5-methylcytosine-specific restriction endonuclease McrA